MRYSNNFAASAATLILAASVVTAAPVAEVSHSGAAFRVHQVNNTKASARNGPLAYAKALSKYGVPLPEDVKNAVASVSNVATPVSNAAAASTTGKVAATPEQYDSLYLCPVSIGTPAQVLNLDFDTGSADLWVFSSLLSAANRAGHSYYTPGSSSTSKVVSGGTWSISYGDGSSASGTIYDDKVTIGGVTVTTQGVEAAKSISSEFTSDTDTDGLVGLSFSSINSASPQQLTWFDNAKSSLASPLFTVDLKAGAAGYYDFGYIDAAAYTGSIFYKTVSTTNGFWQLSASGYGIGSAAFVASTYTTIADTGTTLLLLPDKQVTAYYAKVSGSSYDSTQGGYVFPCSATLPDFTFGVGTYRGVIPGKYMNYAPVTSSSCYGGIQSDSGIGFAIWGDILLKAQFVVFDSGNTRIGFAAKTL